MKHLIEFLSLLSKYNPKLKKKGNPGALAKVSEVGSFFYFDYILYSLRLKATL